MTATNEVAEVEQQKLQTDSETKAATATRSNGAKESESAAIDLGFIGSKEEVAETRSVTSRIRLRSQLGSDIERFLAQGGAINKIAADVTADPPKKPESNYGSRAI